MTYVTSEFLEESSCGLDGSTFCVLTCPRIVYIIVSFGFLVNRFIFLLIRCKLNFYERFWIYRKKNTCSSEAGYSLSHTGNLQITFVEQLYPLVLRNFLMRTSFQVQITLPVESSFQWSIKPKTKSL